MDAKSVIWHFTNSLHEVDDKKYKDLKLPRKVAIINKAKDIFFKEILSNRSKNPIFDQWLRPLEIDDFDLKFDKKTDEYYLYEYPERFAVATYVRIETNKGECTSKFEATPIMDKSAANAIINPFWEPSFEFEQTFRTKNKDGIKIWRKDFEIVKAYISYVQRPVDMHAPTLIETGNGYIYHDNKRYTKDVDLSFGDDAYLPIIDIAVLLAKDSNVDLNLEISKILNIKQYQNG